MTDDHYRRMGELRDRAARMFRVRRMERWLSRPTYLADAGMSRHDIDTARFQANALAMAGASPETYATNRGSRVEMFGYALVTYPAGFGDSPYSLANS